MSHALLVALLSLAATFVPQTRAAAHRPVDPVLHGVTEIPDLRTSYAFYRDLASGETQAYHVEGEEGAALSVGTSIPRIDGLEAYGVTIALVGPGLPRPTAPLPITLDPGDGAIVREPADRGEFFEPFTQTSYRTGSRIELPLPAGGDYLILVWRSDHAAGKYVLDSGTEEVFGPADLFLFPAWWVSVNAYFGYWDRIAIAGLASALLVALALRAIARRLRRRARGPVVVPGLPTVALRHTGLDVPDHIPAVPGLIARAPRWPADQKKEPTERR